MPSLAHFLVVLGTRPEAIKLAPVVLELRRRGEKVLLAATGQHRELAADALALFGLRPDFDLDIMRPRQNLDYVFSRTLAGVGKIIDREGPRAVIVQGDTSSAAAAALAAFHWRLPVAHVEAGLRSGDLAQPFPEEFNRRSISIVAHWNFAPTSQAAEHLFAERVGGAVFVTGNTVVDAVRHVLRVDSDMPPALARFAANGPYLLVTAHRRESWGEPIRQVAEGVARILEALPGYRAVVVGHPNPNAREPIDSSLGPNDRVLIVDSLPYPVFLRLLQGCALAVSDSGGVQEEGPALGVPVLVTRNATERPEGVLAGAAELVGTDQGRIVERAVLILTDASRADAMSKAGPGTYGDGHAAERIVDVLVGDGNRAEAKATRRFRTLPR